MNVARTLRRTVLIAAAGALVLAATAAAGPYTQGPLVLASGPSPFAACTVGGPGTNYPNAELEPFVAVNPTDAKNIIGVFQQDPWNNGGITGGAHGLVAAVTHDGGQTWSETWAHFSTCSGGTPANGGNYDRASDPWVTFAPNGDAYQISLSESADRLTSAVLVSKSTTGGDTWSEPTTLISESSFFDSNDKPSSRVIDISTEQSVPVRDPDNGAALRTGRGLPDVAVNPNDGTLYVVWSDSRFSGGVRDDVAFSKSTDGGRTWSMPIKVNQTPIPVPAFTPSVELAADGTVGVSYYDFRNNTSAPGALTDAWLVHSHDGGATWEENRLTPTPFDIEQAPIVGAYFLGEYQGLTSVGSTFAPFFIEGVNAPADPTDAFFTTVGP